MRMDGFTCEYGFQSDPGGSHGQAQEPPARAAHQKRLG